MPIPTLNELAAQSNAIDREPKANPVGELTGGPLGEPVRGFVKNYVDSGAGVEDKLAKEVAEPQDIMLSEGLYVPALERPDGPRGTGEGTMKESSRNRALILKLAQGVTQRQAAQEMGMTEGTVSKLMSQPWFRDKLLTIMHHKAEPHIEQRLRVARDEALAVTRHLMHFAASEETRRQAATALLKTTLGDKVNLTAMPKNMEEIEAALKRQDEELKELGGCLGKPSPLGSGLPPDSATVPQPVASSAPPMVASATPCTPP